jgi:hypothetical protein
MLDANQTPPRQATVPTGALGLRRIEQVRVIVSERRTVAEVTGIAHRYPRTFRVSLAAAAQLADAGVPMRIEHRSERANGEVR